MIQFPCVLGRRLVPHLCRVVEKGPNGTSPCRKSRNHPQIIAWHDLRSGGQVRGCLNKRQHTQLLSAEFGRIKHSSGLLHLYYTIVFHGSHLLELIYSSYTAQIIDQYRYGSEIPLIPYFPFHARTRTGIPSRSNSRVVSRVAERKPSALSRVKSRANIIPKSPSVDYELDFEQVQHNCAHS